ncbi:type II secretion system protein [Pelagicoccus sp. SDUM812003]|uniref:type II secretion system protein n=1 Tax=Pelagicoccus sp. SDUM812003 TaxID=3041267 RepID=UPI00280CC683|nr:type II secretion system protein [Pelagicoccus sp. SDUM812003]MDQ8202120.1 type II secretion system protein [Pelagicoccus sp. SDUM812003]
MTTLSHNKRGFTLIELLTVIAIVAILSAILVPTVGQFRTLAKKTSDVNDLRRIVQASQMFAAQNGEKFVGPQQTLGADGIIDIGSDNDIVDVAAVLALGGELNDPGVWQSENEKKTLPGGGLYTFIADADGDGLGAGEGYSVNTNLSPDDFSFDYVTGLATWMQSTTPVAFSRMATPSSSTWGDTDVYQSSGGHIAFLNGSVTWYEDLTDKLITPTGQPADSIQEAISDIATAEIRSSLP